MKKTKTKICTKAATGRPRTPAGRSRADRVWHVFRFRERFELADDQRFCRKGPLIYARDYVTPADDESCAYLQQVENLRRQPDGLELEGAWSRIRASAARRSRAYRGFLLNERLEPALNNEIANTVLYVTPQRAEKIFLSLEAIGLIERIPIPDWDLSLNDLPKKATTKRQKNSGQDDKISREATRNLVRARENTSAAERRRAPLNKNESRIEKKSKRNILGSASDNFNSKAQLQSKDAGQAATTPATTPPIKPTLSDHQGTRIAASGPAPGGSVRNNPLHISHALDTVRRKCNAAAMQAGREIYSALGGPYAEGSAEAAREVGCFAAAFERVMATGLGPMVLVDLWQDLITEAVRLRKLYAKNGNGYKSSARVWCKRILPGKMAAAAKESVRGGLK